MPSLELFIYSAKAIGTILLIALAGLVLVRAKILQKDSLQVLSKVVINLMIPCLLFTKVAQTVDLARLLAWWMLPVTGIIFTIIGCSLGFITSRLCRPKPPMINGVVAASGLGNAGFLPIPLIMTVCLIFPQFSERPEAADLGVAYISVYLMTFSPLLWTVGYNILAGRKLKDIRIAHFITPPVIGMLLGITVGLTPALKGLFCGSNSLLNPIFQACQTIAMATVPCAMIVLGGMLAYGPRSNNINHRTIVGVIITKLILLPLIAILYIKGLRYGNLIPLDPLLAVVLVIEAATPPATNLVVIAAMHKQNEDDIATLIFWNYLAAIPTLTIFTMLGVWIFSS